MEFLSVKFLNQDSRSNGSTADLPLPSGNRQIVTQLIETCTWPRGLTQAHEKERSRSTSSYLLPVVGNTLSVSVETVVTQHSTFRFHMQDQFPVGLLRQTQLITASV